MSKAIVETCSCCEGRHVVNVEEKCWECRGSGNKSEQVQKPCRACNATGRYVKKVGKHKHICRTCKRCDGKGYKLVWAKTAEDCDVCKGSGLYRKRRRCPSCRGKGKMTINSLESFITADVEKKLQVIRKN